MVLIIEVLKWAESVSLNPLGLNLLKRKMSKRIEFLEENDGNIALIVFLRNGRNLLDNLEFRMLVRSIKKSMEE